MPNLNSPPEISVEKLSFQKYWQDITRHWLIIILVTGGAVGLTALIVSRRMPDYEASGKVIIKLDRATTLVGLSGDSGKLESLTYKTDPLNTQAELIRSTPVIQSTIEALNLKDEKTGNKLTIRDFSKKLQVKLVTGADILQIRYRDRTEAQAIAVVNQLMQSFIENSIANNRIEAVVAGKFLQEQVPKTEAAVTQAELNLKQFKEVNGVISLPQEAEDAVKRLSTLTTHLTEGQALLNQANARSTELQNQLGMTFKEALNASALSQSSGVQRALGELQAAEAQLAKQQTLYRGAHPSLPQLERQVASAREQLQKQIVLMLGSGEGSNLNQLQVGKNGQELITELARTETERVSMQARLQTLSQAQTIFSNRASTLPALEKRQRELERQLDAAQLTYKTLLTKFQEVQLSENQTVGNARIVSQAEILPPSLTSSKTLLLLLGSIAGLSLGIAAAFLASYLDRSVSSIKAARELFPYPLLGIIPSIKGLSKQDSELPKLLGRDVASSAIQDAYQMLHANLRFLGSDAPLRSIVVTSSVRKEGKSTITANLALAIAQCDRRVLLIDADWRNACQHHVWQVNNLSGLSNVIVNQTTFDQAVQTILPNLDLLTAGATPPNPIALLDSARMAFLITQFTQDYDFVIFDAPALAGTADARVLNELTDGSLLVVRPNQIDQVKGKISNQYITESGQTLLGIVVNHFDVRREPDSYFYFTQSEEIQPTLSDRAAYVPLNAKQ
jgi:polysaccharide biosynthesis transport protein